MPPYPPVIPDSHDPLTFPPQPGLGKERPQLHSWLEGSGHCLPTVARMVFESFAHVPVTEELLRHVWEGERNGRDGGHRFGLGREGKTEFPEQWDLEMVRLSIVEVLSKPQVIQVRRGGVVCIRQVGRVVMTVWLVRSRKNLYVQKAFPLSGDGVYQNLDGLRVSRPLDLSVLEA